MNAIKKKYVDLYGYFNYKEKIVKRFYCTCAYSVSFTGGEGEVILSQGQQLLSNLSVTPYVTLYVLDDDGLRFRQGVKPHSN